MSASQSQEWRRDEYRSRNCDQIMKKVVLKCYKKLQEKKYAQDLHKDCSKNRITGEKNYKTSVCWYNTETNPQV
jgi:hypothetical protein